MCRAALMASIFIRMGNRLLGTGRNRLKIAFTGETYYSESDVPGSSVARTDFGSMGVQRYTDNSLVGTCGNAYLSPYSYAGAYRYGTDGPACNHVRVWTN